MLLLLIVACELGFWVFLFSGLITRYYFKKDMLSRVLLLCVPLLDLILLIATFADLNRGAEVKFAHGLAAVYLGFTVVFGKSVIAWADQKISAKFNSSTDSQTNKLAGWAYAWHEWKVWCKGVVACSVASVILYIAKQTVAHNHQIDSLTDWYYILINLMILWGLFGPIWYSIFHKRYSK